MSIEAMKQALNKAFNLGQTYWQQANSEYSSYWIKADVTQVSFEQLVEETCQAIEQAQKQEPVAWRTYIGRGYYIIDPTFEDAQKNWPDKEHQPLYKAPPQRPRVVFPTMLRKMWSGSEVQAWLDENVNKENT